MKDQDCRKSIFITKKEMKDSIQEAMVMSGSEEFLLLYITTAKEKLRP